MFIVDRLFDPSMYASMTKEITLLNKGNSQNDYKKNNKGGFNKIN